MTKVLEVETAVEAICPSMLVAALKLHIEPENVPIMFEMVPIAEHVDEQASPHVRKAAAWTALAASEKTGRAPGEWVRNITGAAAPGSLSSSSGGPFTIPA